MKKPLNGAVLKYFTTVERASAEDVMAALKPEYGGSKPFTKKEISELLMTAVVNGILEEADFDLDKNNEVRIFYTANDVSRGIINKYFPN